MEWIKWLFKVEQTPAPLRLVPVDQVNRIAERAAEDVLLGNPYRTPPGEPIFVGYEFTAGANAKWFQCGACGWETNDTENLMAHLDKHGATRYVIEPVNRRSRR